jgi:hypothetical protein
MVTPERENLPGCLLMKSWFTESDSCQLGGIEICLHLYQFNEALKD